jgi:hypothetical protein
MPMTLRILGLGNAAASWIRVRASRIDTTFSLCRDKSHQSTDTTTMICKKIGPFILREPCMKVSRAFAMGFTSRLILFSSETRV